MVKEQLQRSWYQTWHPLSWLMLPLSLLFYFLVSIRGFCYHLGFFKRYKVHAPVIIVGNITVGGSGKTPLVCWLVKCLQQAGFHPGVVSRGYGGQSRTWPVSVNSDSDTALVGDEAVLIATQTAVPVVVAPNRVAAAEYLLNEFAVDVIISDDGLQHYALHRDIEIAVIDGRRGLGNGWLLPAGPLREPSHRLNDVDFVIANGKPLKDANYLMQLVGDEIINIQTGEQRRLKSLDGMSVHAIAGIGDPQRFFDDLTKYGLVIEEHPFADHHQFKADEINFNDDKPVLMTHKDAVKCQPFATTNHWYRPVVLSVDDSLGKAIVNKLEKNIEQ